MTSKYTLEVELPDDKYCDGCPNHWTDCNGERCGEEEDYLFEDKDRNIIRPEWCPLKQIVEKSCGNCKFWKDDYIIFDFEYCFCTSEYFRSNIKTGSDDAVETYSTFCCKFWEPKEQEYE